MNRLFAIAILLMSFLFPTFGEESKREPEKITMSLVWIADAETPLQYIFVINGAVAYQTIDGLKKYLKDLPPHSTVTWSPGCCRMGNEPLLGSKEEMDKFKTFCAENDINFILVPSG